MFVYIAGPMTHGNQFDNFKNAIAVADRIFKRGHCVVVPQLTFFWNMLHENSYEAWLAMDFQWISKCDALVRIPGLSDGADREVVFAHKSQKLVFQGLNEFMNSRYWTVL